MESSITQDEFAFLVRRAGIALSADKLAELHGIYGYIEAMAARVREHGAADPALVFTPVEERE
jgi:hypothetical protein